MERSKSIISLGLIILFLLAQIPFSVAEWIAVAPAPSSPGIYDVIIRANYEDVSGDLPMTLTVGDSTYPLGQLEVEPVYPISKNQPIRLRYDIGVNGSTAFEMVWNQVNIYYVSGNVLLKSEDMALEKNAETGYWESSFDVPFKGEYRAVVSLIVRKGDEEYGGEFMTQFESNSVSSGLTLEGGLDKQILVSSEEFEVYMEAIYEERHIANMSIFKVTMNGDTSDLLWERRGGAYVAELTAPVNEGIYLVDIFAQGQDFVIRKKIYVAETGREKSARCPLTYEEVQGCNDMRDVRICVLQHKGESIRISEQDIISCYESASGGITYGAISCDEDFKGDLDGDRHLDLDDLDLLKNIVLPLEETEREQYDDCADYDLNGKVEQADLTCLTKVIAGTWWGDLRGGVCIDSAYDANLKGDLDSDDFITDDDMDMMETVIEASEEGVDMHQIILDFTDFNQDGRITNTDKRCMEYFLGMEIGNSDTLLAFGQTIPRECLMVYHLNACQSIRGDINGDLRIDALDEILISLIEREQIDVGDYDMECADVNIDGFISEEDVVCVLSYLQGDFDAYYVCIGCDDAIPDEFRKPYEICNDGFDNDCDGMVDRTSRGPDDKCLCTEETECWRVWDNDGGAIPGVGDANVKVCRMTDWGGGDSATSGAASSSYHWHLPGELACGSGRECQSMYCAGTRYVCAYNGLSWDWYSNPGDLPQESNIPTDQPKLCEDEYDNDCCNGDMECEESDWTDMFSEPSFWIGAILGAALSIIFPGFAALALYISLASSALSMVIPNSGVSAFFSGFGLGAGLGAIASSAMSTATQASAQAGAQAGQQTAAQAAQAAKEAAVTATKEAMAQGLGTTMSAANPFLQLSISAAAAAGSSLTSAVVGIAALGAVAYATGGSNYEEQTEEEWDRHFASC